METPRNINDIDGDFVEAYCREQGQEVTAYVNSLYDQPPKPDKNGAERDISFIEIRNEFARKYFPDLAPKAKTKPKTLKQRLADLAQQQ